MLDSDKEFIIEKHKTLTINEMQIIFEGRYTKKQLKNFCDNNKLAYKKLSKDELSYILSNEREYTKQRQQTPINHDYFKIWSRNMSYIFGLWCADGYIKNQSGGYYFSIKLHKNDRYLLEDILKDMKSEHKIYENKDNCCHITISSKTIYNDIIALGGVERKSLILKFPNVPNEFLSDFIRGYFDGDGCISKVKNGYILGTFEFCASLKDILFKNGIEISDIVQKHPEYGEDNNCYVLGIYRKKQFELFANYIYKDLDDNILFLKRKYERT